MDRLLLKMPVRLGPMAREPPKAQISGGIGAVHFYQRVEDNAFHPVRGIEEMPDLRYLRVGDAE